MSTDITPGEKVELLNSIEQYINNAGYKPSVDSLSYDVASWLTSNIMNTFQKYRGKIVYRFDSPNNDFSDETVDPEVLRLYEMLDALNTVSNREQVNSEPDFPDEIMKSLREDARKKGTRSPEYTTLKEEGRI
jgi:SOS-response transcriptional repressor LexA